MALDKATKIRGTRGRKFWRRRFDAKLKWGLKILRAVDEFPGANGVEIVGNFIEFIIGRSLGSTDPSASAPQPGVEGAMNIKATGVMHRAHHLSGHSRGRCAREGVLSVRARHSIQTWV